LKDLELSNSRIGDAGLEAANDSLDKLVVGGNRFGIVGLTSLANCLKNNKGLRALFLWNNCRRRGSGSVGRGVKSVSGNSIGDEGMAALGMTLQVNTSLTELNLSNSIIGGRGVVALGEALKVNPSLTRLSLNGNGSAVSLGEALKVNTSLTLEENAIGDEGASSLLDVLTEHNTTLMGLCLHHGIPGAIRFAIFDFIEANRAGARLLHAGPTKWILRRCFLASG
jgi:Ran GTPase-activating protein (RanGAP) involved in mRNA processing and transport